IPKKVAGKLPNWVLGEEVKKIDVTYIYPLSFITRSQFIVTTPEKYLEPKDKGSTKRNANEESISRNEFSEVLGLLEHIVHKMNCMNQRVQLLEARSSNNTENTSNNTENTSNYTENTSNYTENTSNEPYILHSDGYGYIVSKISELTNRVQTIEESSVFQNDPKN
ncbi:11355_t:CDS:2, partial [Racocetra persica]